MTDQSASTEDNEKQSVSSDQEISLPAGPEGVSSGELEELRERYERIIKEKDAEIARLEQENRAIIGSAIKQAAAKFDMAKVTDKIEKHKNNL
ncbi:MAG: hypothetical protein ABIC95_02910 [archaeon]